MFHKSRTQRGQALVLIVFAIVGLIAMVGLAVDSGSSFADHRNAQSAADNAALAAALAKVNPPQDWELAATNMATSNGYTDNGVTTVDVYSMDDPSAAGCGSALPVLTNPEEYILVTIHSTVNLMFGPIVGARQVHNCVYAITYAKPGVNAPLFNGAAVVGLNPSTTNCAIDTGNSNAKSWTLTGGGIYSNGCVNHPNGTLNIPDDKCITAVGDANISGGGNHDCVQENQPANTYNYPADVAAIMPPNPCTGAITSGRYAGGGKVPAGGQISFANDVFCISDFDAFDKEDVVLSNATLYVTDTAFSLKFAGGGGFTGTPSSAGTYKGYYMIIALLSKAEADSCQQTVEYRGNGSGDLVGTILAPSTCWDYRGNSTGDSTRSQMIFYEFTSNGNATINIDFAPIDNATHPDPPAVELTQ